MSRHIVIDARIRRSTTGRYTDRLVEHLQDIDHTNRYTILVQPDDPWQMHAGNFTTLPCPFPQFSLNPLTELRFAGLVYRLKPDLVHFTMTQYPLLYFGNIICTTHDLTMFKFVRRGTMSMTAYKVKIGLYKFLIWWGHAKAKAIITPTKFVAEDIARFQPSTKPKLYVTLEASEPPLTVPAEKPQSAGDWPFLLYVGTAFPHKNLFKMVEAFELLHAKHPDLRLVITGKPTEKHHAELISWVQARPVHDYVVFPGFVSDPELKWLYEHCAAYVFTSLSEGFGLPPLEAMTYGAPVACSNASCMPEVNGDAAHYFDATNIHDIAGKVDEVITQPALRKTLIAKGYQQIKKYSWKKMAKETLTIYKKVLSYTR